VVAWCGFRTLATRDFAVGRRAVDAGTRPLVGGGVGLKAWPMRNNRCRHQEVGSGINELRYRKAEYDIR
jgi:hypothetical protein